MGSNEHCDVAKRGRNHDVACEPEPKGEQLRSVRDGVGCEPRWEPGGGPATCCHGNGEDEEQVFTGRHPDSATPTPSCQ